MINVFNLYDITKQLENYIKFHQGDEDFEKNLKEKIKRLYDLTKESK